MKTTFTLVALLAATTTMAQSIPDDNCCVVWAGQNFMRLSDTFCLPMGYAESRQQAEEIRIFLDIWDNGSIKCGKYVDALVCPNGFDYGPIAGQREHGYKCESGSIFVEHGTEVGAGEHLGYIPVEARGSSIILSFHPWVAKGKKYLSLNRTEKSHILWNKIVADRTTNWHPVNPLDFFDMDQASVFDEFGDEFDCRDKTGHVQGNVAQIEWRNIDGHHYTGMFEGADTGFVRLNVQHPVIPPAWKETDDQIVMMASISVKLLRDGVDSANSLANQNLVGQTGYNFFAAPLFTNLKDSGFNNEDLQGDVVQANWAQTNFVSSLGNSDMALYDQEGVKVAAPIFPYSIRYQPNPALSYHDPAYTRTIFDRMREIPTGTVLYEVWARNKPSTLGGVEGKIAEIVTKSELTPSMWGDTRMYFRHQRHDDDFRYRPDWMLEPTHGTFTFEGESINLHPYIERRLSSCPFSWLFMNW